MIEQIKAEIESIFDVSVIHDTLDAPHVDGQAERTGPPQLCGEYDLLATKGNPIHLFYLLPKGRKTGPAQAILSVGGDQLDGFTLSDEMIAEGVERIECAKLGVHYNIKKDLTPDMWQDMKDKARAESKGEA